MLPVRGELFFFNSYRWFPKTHSASFDLENLRITGPENGSKSEILRSAEKKIVSPHRFQAHRGPVVDTPERESRNLAGESPPFSALPENGVSLLTGGEGGIRTLGTLLGVHTLSRRAP